MRTSIFNLIRPLLLLQIFITILFCIQAEPNAKLAPVIEKGQQIFICGHSFHVYVEKMLEEAAKDAGIVGHTTIGTQFIGGSTVTQHWELPKAKDALRTGKVDVLTLAPHLLMPDPGIDNYAELAIKNNPDIRIFIQLSWLPFDGNTSNTFQKSQYNEKTVAELKKLNDSFYGEYVSKVKAQINAINKKYDKTFVYMVPVGYALNTLRQQVAAGTFPGISLQSNLFTDPMGHPSVTVKWLVTYCFYAAIYHRNPIGLKTNEKPGDDISHQQNLTQLPQFEL
jgi:hypothetical protein